MKLRASDYVTLAVALLAILVTTLVLSRNPPPDLGAGSIPVLTGPPATVPSPTRVRVVNGERWSTLLDGGHVIGPDRAEVKILEFSDFRCSFCAEFFDTMTQLQERYPDNIALVYKHFVPLDGPSFEIALASECAAEQEAFDRFYANAFEHRWRAADRDELTAFARSIGVGDIRQFDACMEDRLYAEKVVEQTTLARRARFSGTPTIVINGVPMREGALSYEKLEEIVLVTLRRR